MDICELKLAPIFKCRFIGKSISKYGNCQYIDVVIFPNGECIWVKSGGCNIKLTLDEFVVIEKISGFKVYSDNNTGELFIRPECEDQGAPIQDINADKKIDNAVIYKGHLTGWSKEVFDRYSIDERTYFVKWPTRYLYHVILIGNDDNILIPNHDFCATEKVDGEVHIGSNASVYIKLKEPDATQKEAPTTTRKERIVRVLYDKLVERRKFIDHVPSSLSSFILDNEYTSSVEISLDRTIDFIFEHDSDSYVQWFFYEWKPGFKITTGESVDGGKIVYKIDNIDDFIRFLHKETQVLAD